MNQIKQELQYSYGHFLHLKKISILGMTMDT